MLGNQTDNTVALCKKKSGTDQAFIFFNFFNFFNFLTKLYFLVLTTVLIFGYNINHFPTFIFPLQTKQQHKANTHVRVIHIRKHLSIFFLMVKELNYFGMTKCVKIAFITECISLDHSLRVGRVSQSLRQLMGLVYRAFVCSGVVGESCVTL